MMPMQFTGKERDAETGLDYFGARYFSGAMGRFTSPDPPHQPSTNSDLTLGLVNSNNHIRNLPTTTQIYDAGVNVNSRTDYLYDGGAVQNDAGIVNQLAAYGTGFMTVEQVCKSVRPGWHPMLRDQLWRMIAAGWDGRITQVKEENGLSLGLQSTRIVTIWSG